MIYTPNYCLKLGTCYFSLCIDASILFFLDQFAAHSWWLAIVALVDVVVLLAAAAGAVFQLRLLLLPAFISRFLLLSFTVLLSSLVLVGPIDSFPLAIDQQRIADCPIAVVAVFLFNVFLVVELVLFSKIWRSLTPSQKEDKQPVVESPPLPPHYLNFEEGSISSTVRNRDPDFVQNMLAISDHRGIPIWLF